MIGSCAKNRTAGTAWLAFTKLFGSGSGHRPRVIVYNRRGAMSPESKRRRCCSSRRRLKEGLTDKAPLRASCLDGAANQQKHHGIGPEESLPGNPGRQETDQRTGAFALKRPRRPCGMGKGQNPLFCLSALKGRSGILPLLPPVTDRDGRTRSFCGQMVFAGDVGFRQQTLCKRLRMCYNKQSNKRWERI